MNHKGATHFTLNDRQTLERMLRKGFSKPAIAEALGKCERSIYYEIGRGLCVQRTTDLIDVEVYCADVAHRKYKAFLKEKGKELKIGHDHALVRRLEELINVRWRERNIGSQIRVGQVWQTVRSVPNVRLIQSILLEGRYDQAGIERLAALEEDDAFPYATVRSGTHLIQIS